MERRGRGGRCSRCSSQQWCEVRAQPAVCAPEREVLAAVQCNSEILALGNFRNCECMQLDLARKILKMMSFPPLRYCFIQAYMTVCLHKNLF